MIDHRRAAVAPTSTSPAGRTWSAAHYRYRLMTAVATMVAEAIGVIEFREVASKLGEMVDLLRDAGATPWTAIEYSDKHADWRPATGPWASGWRRPRRA